MTHLKEVEVEVPYCLTYLFNLVLLYPNDPKPIKGRNVTPEQDRFLKRKKDEVYQYKLSQKSSEEELQAFHSILSMHQRALVMKGWTQKSLTQIIKGY